ncbi:hypothetical protein ACD661_02350 [Legionella lytica]|uniref:Purine NTPase n=1 Tax=Legionella lytica TaxID=96232 RepID=A0ABW8D3X0_9GAMM
MKKNKEKSALLAGLIQNLLLGAIQNLSSEHFIEPIGFTDETHQSQALKYYMEIRAQIELLIKKSCYKEVPLEKIEQNILFWLEVANHLRERSFYEGALLIEAQLALIPEAKISNQKLLKKIETLSSTDGNHSNMRRSLEKDKKRGKQDSQSIFPPIYLIIKDLTPLKQNISNKKDNYGFVLSTTLQSMQEVFRLYATKRGHQQWNKISFLVEDIGHNDLSHLELILYRSWIVDLMTLLSVRDKLLSIYMSKEYTFNNKTAALHFSIIKSVMQLDKDPSFDLAQLYNLTHLMERKKEALALCKQILNVFSTHGSTQTPSIAACAGDLISIWDEALEAKKSFISHTKSNFESMLILHQKVISVYSAFQLSLSSPLDSEVTVYLAQIDSCISTLVSLAKEQKHPSQQLMDNLIATYNLLFNYEKTKAEKAYFFGMLNGPNPDAVRKKVEDNLENLEKASHSLLESQISWKDYLKNALSGIRSAPLFSEEDITNDKRTLERLLAEASNIDDWDNILENDRAPSPDDSVRRAQFFGFLGTSKVKASDPAVPNDPPNISPR